MFEHARSRTVFTIAVAAAAAASCRSATEPTPSPAPIAVNTVVSGSVDGVNPTRSYTFRIPAYVYALVYATVTTGAIEISLEDVSHSIDLGPVTVTAGGDSIGTTPLLQVTEPQAGTLTLTVTGSPKGSGATYQLLYYVLSDAPEHVADSIFVGDTVDKERLDLPGDVDTYRVFAPAASDFAIVLEEVGGAGVMCASLGFGSALCLTSAGVPLATDAVHAPLSGYMSYVIRSGDGVPPSSPEYQGSYRLWSYLIDRAPERAPAAAPFNTIISGESIDRTADIDEFRFTAGADSEIAVFYQATATSHLEVVDPSGQVIGTRVASRPDTAMFGAMSGRLVLSPGKTYTARVVSDGHALADTGAYRLYVYAVNPGPEHAPALLAPGDSVMQEAIDLPGDVGEFHGAISESTWVNLAVGDSEPMPVENSLRADLLDSATGQVVASASAYGEGTTTQFGTGTLGQTGAMQLAPGHYVVRVAAQAVQGFSTLRGPYQLWLHTFTLGPEHVSDTLAIGDTVISETLAPEADKDVFRFYGTRAQHVDLAFQGLGAPLPQGSFVAYVRDPGGQPLAALYSAVSSPTRVVESGRMDLAATGWYTISVYGGSWPTPVLGETGPYRLALVPIGSAPETASPAVVVGDSVTTEALENADDLDQFMLTATPGRQVVVLLGTPAGCTGSEPLLQAVDTATGAVLAAVSTCPSVTQPMEVTAPVAVPASGQLAISVSFGHASSFRECFDERCGGGDIGRTPYVFQVLPFSSLPETAPATYVLGDTVSTEAVDRPGDVDEFTLAATPGATLQPFFRELADPQPAGSFLTIEVVDSATGAVLTSGTYGSGQTTFVSPGTFVVPASGVVLIRVNGTGYQTNEISTGPYAFYVANAP